MWQKTKNLYHLLVAILANTYFLFPGRQLKVIGITGTDGKTTTTSLIYHILKTAGKQVSLISTVAAYIGDATYDTGFHVTNPSSLPLQRFLRNIAKLAKTKEENYLVLEVTSHGIDQNRIWGIPFFIAGLTNISHEHLDYHKTYDNYLQTKARLLKKAEKVVINKDDMSYEKILPFLQEKKITTYGFKKADITLETVRFQTALPGEYNQYNCLLAVAITRELGISDEKIQEGIKSFVPPRGRAEVVYDKNFSVMVDFAHTPNAFAQLLPAIKSKTKGKLIHVFGSAGLRDQTKRPLMGKASAEFADTIILTAEDPRTEKVEDINTQIKMGITKKKEVYEVPDRQKAITKAIALAQKGDYIVITGKAHERSMNYGNGEIPWSDYDAIEKALKEKTTV